MQRSSFIPNRTWLNKRSRAPAYTSHLVTVPAGYNLLACLTFFGCSPVTRVELELNPPARVTRQHCQYGSTSSKSLFFFFFFLQQPPLTGKIKN